MTETAGTECLKDKLHGLQRTPWHRPDGSVAVLPAIDRGQSHADFKLRSVGAAAAVVNFTHSSGYRHKLFGVRPWISPRYSWQYCCQMGTFPHTCHTQSARNILPYAYNGTACACSCVCVRVCVRDSFRSVYKNSIVSGAWGYSSKITKFVGQSASSVCCVCERAHRFTGFLFLRRSPYSISSSNHLFYILCHLWVFWVF